MTTLVIGASGVTGLFTAEAVPECYVTLNRTSFNSPNSVLGPVWTTLYLLMGISLFLIWKKVQAKDAIWKFLSFRNN